MAKVLGHKKEEVHLSFAEELKTKSDITYTLPKPEDVLWRVANTIMCFIESPVPVERSKRSFKIRNAATKAVNCAEH